METIEVEVTRGEDGTLTGKTARPAAPTADPSATPAPGAAFGQIGIIRDIADFEFAGIPIGAAVIGGGLAVLGSALLDRVLGAVNIPGNFDESIVKLGGSWAMHEYGGRLVGQKSADLGSLFMAYDAVDQQVTDALAGVVSAIRGAKLGQVGGIVAGPNVVSPGTPAMPARSLDQEVDAFLSGIAA